MYVFIHCSFLVNNSTFSEMPPFDLCPLGYDLYIRC